MITAGLQARSNEARRKNCRPSATPLTKTVTPMGMSSRDKRSPGFCGWIQALDFFNNIFRQTSGKGLGHADGFYTCNGSFRFFNWR